MRARSLIRQFSSGVIPLHGKNYIEIAGKDTKKFLQGLITNDVNLLTKNQPILASALLSPKGRIVADLILYDFSTGDDQQKVLLEVNHSQASALIRYLTLYKLRSSISIESKLDYQTILQPKNNSSTPHGSFLQAADPRIPNLIDRVLIDRSVSSNQFEKAVSLAEYETFRLLNGLSESEEIEGQIPLEFNLDLLHYISFTKGCYIGQELTARTKYRGVVRKRVVPFVIADSNNSFPTSSIPGFDRVSNDLVNEIEAGMRTNPINRPPLNSSIFRRSGGESIGVVVKMGQYSNLGLALIKLQELKPFSSFTSEVDALGSDFVVEGNSIAERVLIRPFRPNWWVDIDPINGNPIIPPVES